MDYPRTSWVFFRGPDVLPEDALRVLARRRLNVSRNEALVAVELPCGPESVLVKLQRGARVHESAARLAGGADPAWGWQLAGCESAFVITCHALYSARPEVWDTWEQVVTALQTATSGFRYTFSDPDSGTELVPPREATG